MKLEYIKANGEYYFPQEPFEQDPSRIDGCYLPICRIKKLMFGRWQIDYHDIFNPSGNHDENTPNTMLILYPSGIEEIKWKL